MRTFQQPDLSHFREPETVSVGDTLVDLISGIVVMLFVIAVGFWIGGLFS